MVLARDVFENRRVSRVLAGLVARQKHQLKKNQDQFSVVSQRFTINQLVPCQSTKYLEDK